MSFLLSFLLIVMALFELQPSAGYDTEVLLIQVSLSAAVLVAMGCSRFLPKVKPARGSQLALSWKPEKLKVPKRPGGDSTLAGSWPYRSTSSSSDERFKLHSCGGGCLLFFLLSMVNPWLGLLGPLLILWSWCSRGSSTGTLRVDRQREGIVLEPSGHFFPRDELFLVGSDTITVPDPNEAGTVTARAPAIITLHGDVLRAEVEPDSSVDEVARGIAEELGLPLMLSRGRLFVEKIPGKGTAVYYGTPP